MANRDTTYGVGGYWGFAVFGVDVDLVCTFCDTEYHSLFSNVGQGSAIRY